MEKYFKPYRERGSINIKITVQWLMTLRIPNLLPFSSKNSTVCVKNGGGFSREYI